MDGGKVARRVKDFHQEAASDVLSVWRRLWENMLEKHEPGVQCCVHVFFLSF